MARRPGAGGRRPRVPRALAALEGATVKQGGRHGTAALAGGRIKWELHTEFLTVTFVRAAEAEGGRTPAPFARFLEEGDGDVVAAMRVCVRGGDCAHPLSDPGSDHVASTVGGGDAEVRSNFCIDDDGFVQVLLVNTSLNAYRTGRMVRRLLEVRPIA